MMGRMDSRRKKDMQVIEVWEWNTNTFYCCALNCNKSETTSLNYNYQEMKINMNY